MLVSVENFAAAVLHHPSATSGACAGGNTTATCMPTLQQGKNWVQMYRLCEGIPRVVLCAGTGVWR